MFNRNGRRAYFYSLIFLPILSCWGENAADLKQRLGWDSCHCNVCDGQFREVSVIPDTIFQKTEITAEKPTYLEKGISLLQGNVTLTQPGRKIEADQILLTLADNRKLSKGELRGNVFFQEKGRLLVVERGDFDFQKPLYQLENGYYRLQTDEATNTYIWGKVRKAQYTTKHLWIENGYLSSCSPEKCTWKIKGKKLHFNFENDEADIYNAFFYLKEVPVLYLPHYTVFLNHKRKSGLLWSVPYYDNHSGYIFGLPIYLNLAPNYDWLIQPNLMSKRGIFIENTIRYLTPKSTGQFYLGNIFHDNQFKTVRENWRSLIKVDEQAGSDLRDSSLNRFGTSWQHNYRINRFWNLNWQINYASDDYFTYHFDHFFDHSGERDQLLNRITCEYRDNHWQWLTKVEAFQTLHPILYGDSEEQYRRLPQTNVHYQNYWGENPFGFTAEWVVFQKRAYGPNSSIVSGRGYFEPFIIFKQNFTDYWKSNISIRAFSNYYQLWDYKQYQNYSVVNVIPAFKIGQTLYLERSSKLFTKLKQTLEPSLTYHFVPYHNQDNLPLFDSFLTNIDCDQLFRENRFVGKDRFGDSNHLILSLKSRFLDQNAFERFNFNVVQAYAFQKHRVQLAKGYSEDPLVKDHFAPLCFQLRGYFTRQISMALDNTWNFSENRIDSVRLMGKYAYSADQVLNIWYHFGINGDQYQQNKPVNLHRLGTAGSINLTRNWQFIGKINYNLSYHRIQDYFAGVSYNGCCWALRIILGQEFVSIGKDFRKHYDTKIYLQFSLKGLTSMGIRDIRSLIKQDIPNYQDQLAKWQNGY